MSHIFSNLVLETNSAYVELLEKKYNLEFPPIFKAFVQTFVFGKFETDNEHFIVHPNEELGYEGFEQTLEKKINIYLEQGDYFLKDKMMPIATSGIYGSGICVCMEGLNRDKLYVNFETIENKFEEISPNILKFISELTETR